jgi:hypothetical protein
MVAFPWTRRSTLPATVESLDDLTGEWYIDVLRRLHIALAPRAYLEIGTRDGRSLVLSTSPSVAIDPAFVLKTAEAVTNKPFCGLYRTTSDDYFASQDPTVALGGKLDLAFLDGMHQCEFLLRDVMHTERHCHAGSVIALHDCLPLEFGITVREMQAKHAVVRPHRAVWWTGDVWRTARALQRFRPDLRLTVLDAPPTGLVLIDRLDPNNHILFDHQAEIVAAMMAMDLERIGLARHAAAMRVQPTSIFDTPAKIRAYFRR